MKKENVAKEISSQKTHHSSSRSVSMRDIVVGYLNAPLYPAYRPCGVTNGASGFTLVELLVVVLIIGILAAVAVPQYQKAVEKSKSAQALTLLTTLGHALNVYYIENGKIPTSLSELDVQIPDWNGNQIWYEGVDVQDTKSNNDWSLQLTWTSLYIGRINGPYKGAGFVYYISSESVPVQQNICAERKLDGIIFEKAKGSYCSKIMGFPNQHTAGGINWFN